MRVAPEPACAAKSTGVSNQGYTATAGIPCTMFNGVFVLSRCHAWCHRHQWNRFHQLTLQSERQDHTTSPSAQTPFVRASLRLGDVRPSHPFPTSVTIAEPPLLWKRDKRNEATDLGVRSMRETATQWHDGQITLTRHALLASHHHSSFRGAVSANPDLDVGNDASQPLDSAVAAEPVIEPARSRGSAGASFWHGPARIHDPSAACW